MFNFNEPIFSVLCCFVRKYWGGGIHIIYQCNYIVKHQTKQFLCVKILKILTININTNCFKYMILLTIKLSEN